MKQRGTKQKRAVILTWIHSSYQYLHPNCTWPSLFNRKYHENWERHRQFLWLINTWIATYARAKSKYFSLAQKRIRQKFSLGVKTVLLVSHQTDQINLHIAAGRPSSGIDKASKNI